MVKEKLVEEELVNQVWRVVILSKWFFVKLDFLLDVKKEVDLVDFEKLEELQVLLVVQEVKILFFE